MSTNKPIRWGYITRALEYYQARGFKYIEASWMVARDHIDVTLPTGREPITTNCGVLVGSAEQSFIELMMQGELQRGNYMAATPCFRDDPVDRLHQKTFFKVELIYYLGDAFQPDLVKVNTPLWTATMAVEAQGFFYTLGPCPKIVTTSEGIDLELGGIEIGSYGVRTHNGLTWVYGTGIAEPRYSTVLHGIGTSTE